MRLYELIVLLHPDLEIDPAAPIEKLEKLIEQHGGKVVKRDNWGKKRLAYKVSKHDFAVYVYFEVSIEPDQVRPLNDAILLTEEVVRHLMVSKIVQRPSATRKAKAKAGKETEAREAEAAAGVKED